MITRKKFLKGEFKTPQKHKGVVTEQIEDFLKTNKKNAYTATEICKRLKINKNTFRYTLRKLKKDKKILHNSPYIMWRL